MKLEDEVLKEVEDNIEKKRFFEYLNKKYEKPLEYFYNSEGKKMIKFDSPGGYIKEISPEMNEKRLQSFRILKELNYNYRNTKVVRKRIIDVTNIKWKILVGRDLIGYERTLYDDELEKIIKEIEFLHENKLLEWKILKEKKVPLKEGNIWVSRTYRTYIDNLEVSLNIYNGPIFGWVGEDLIRGDIWFRSKNKQEVHIPSYILKSLPLLSIYLSEDR